MAMLVLTVGCSANGPSQDSIKEAVKAALPVTVSLQRIECTNVKLPAGDLQIRFHASCSVTLDLYDTVTALIGFPAPVIKASRQRGESLDVIGTLVARRYGDTWQYRQLTIESGLDHLGMPRERYPGDALIEGTSRYDSIVSSWRHQQDTIQRTQDSLRRKREQETREAAAERARRQDSIRQVQESIASDRRESNRNVAIRVFALNRTCTGDLNYRQSSTPMTLRITRADSLYEVMCEDTKSSFTQRFIGRLRIEGDRPELVLESTSTGTNNQAVWWFYQLKGTLRLWPNDVEGLDGDARAGNSSYHLSLNECGQ
jgi:hypothetical protein